METTNPIFQEIWKLNIPSKVTCLIWRVMLDRLPTKDNLRMRNIILEESDLLCPLCNYHRESAQHLFISCLLVSSIWYEYYGWTSSDFVIVVLKNLSIHFWLHSTIGRSTIESLI